MAREYPTDQELERLARRVLKTAVRVKGERELRYVPRDPEHEDRHLAGQPAAQYAGIRFYQADEDGNFLGTEADWARLEAQHVWIEEFILNHIGPDPAGFDPAIEHMDRVTKSLYDPATDISPVDARYRDAEVCLEGWSGTAANTFRSKFLSKIPDVVRAQAFVAWTLYHAMSANQDIFVEARKDLKKITESAIDSLDRVGQGSSVNWTVALGVVAATAALGSAGAGIFAGAAVINTFNVIAGVSSAGSLGLSFADPKQREADAGSVDRVLEHLVDAVIEDTEEINVKERELVNALRHNTEQMWQFREEKLLPSEPTFVDRADDRAYIEREFTFDSVPA